MHGPAFDEVAHLTAGTSYLVSGDFRFQPENGLLPQAWAGLPLALDPAITPPRLEGEAWQTSDVWTSSRAFLFVDGDWRVLLARGRAMIALLLFLTWVLVWRWSRRLFGVAGGLLSLALAVLSPSLLAHGALVTSDLAAAGFFLASVGACWRLSGRVDARNLVLGSAAVLGLVLSKASAVLILPMVAIMLLVRGATRTLAPSGRVLGAAVGVAALVVGGMWGAYGLRSSPFSPEHSEQSPSYSKPLEPMLQRAGALEAPLRLALDHRLLPEAWLYGFTFVLAHSEARPAMLRGEHRRTGWWWFFPYAAAIKTPLPLLALVLLGLVAALAPRRRGPSDPRGWLELTPLLSLIAVYWAFSLTSHLNIGHRHLLPLLPALFVLAGAGAGWLRSRVGRLAIGGLLGALALEVLVAWPDYLAYMNPLAGRERWRHLVDSSLDWGQEGPRLAEALERRAEPGEPVFLSWFGSTDPRHYGIVAEPLPSFMAWRGPGTPAPLRPGLYAISATQLQGVYSRFPPPWTEAQEQVWEASRAGYRAWLLSSDDVPARARLLTQANEGQWTETLQIYDELRFARLSAWLRAQGHPLETVGHAVVLYRLSAADLQAAMAGAGPLPPATPAGPAPAASP